jgi:hypothetical protein
MLLVSARQNPSLTVCISTIISSKGFLSVSTLGSLNTVQDIYNVPLTNLKVGEYMALDARLEGLIRVSPTSTGAHISPLLNIQYLESEPGKVAGSSQIVIAWRCKR